jgi:chitodextrinase
MSHRRVLGRIARVGAWALALTLVTSGVALASSGTIAAAPTTPSVASTWSTDFSNFHTPSWNNNYGLTSDTQVCKGATSSSTCNWGYSNFQPVSDPTAPGGGQALKTTYPAPSGPPSCGCGLGGGQMYQDLSKSTAPGAAALAASPTLDLKYYYNFPVGFDFGKKLAGKMPGLWGGGVPGCESGGQHCQQGWSTRYMWRGGSANATDGELYFYTASGGGFGADLCKGNWKFAGDGKWHSIEQQVNTTTGSITVWSDGGSTPVCQTTQTLPGANSGVFFSTFHGGHDTSWSPSKTTTDEFADFTLATGQQTGGGPATPATPTGLTASGATSSSLNLSWSQADNADPAVSYKVFEGTAVVATPTATSATISGLAPNTSHTYTVEAVDSAGNVSTPSMSATGTTSGGGTNTPATPTGLATSGATTSSLKLSWSETNNADPAVSYKVYEGTTVVATPTTTSATITGLAPNTGHTYTVSALDSTGAESAQSVPATGQTSSSSGGGLTVTIAKTKDWGNGFTDSATITNKSGSAVNGWNVQFDLDASENIESESNATLTTSGNHYTFTNTGSSGSIANGASVTVVFSGDYTTGYLPPTNVTVNGQGTGGGGTPAVPTGLAVSAATSSSLKLSWSETDNTDPAVSYKVYEGSVVVATPTAMSATIGGLAAGSSHTYTVVAVDSAGATSAQSASVTGATNPNSTGPATPTGLAVSGTTSSSVNLSWSETNNSDPAVSYKVYEGSVVVATPTTTSATISGLAPGSSHSYTVSAVDSAGVESAPSAPVTATTSGGGGGSGFSQPEIDSAVAAPLFAWAAPTSAVPRPGTNPVNIGESKVVYYLALVDKVAPGAKATGGTTVDSALLAQVRTMISGGKEPDSDGGLEMWAQAPVAQALLLLKNGPAWSELTAPEQNKVTLLEAAMGYGSNYTYNDANSFSSGICGFGNFSKTNNPNYRDGGVDTEIAAIQFFGAANWDSMLTSFSDATVTSQLKAAGLTNSGQCFAAVGTGGNAAIARAFLYQGHHSSDLMGIWNTIAGNTFDKTAQSTVSPAHIADGTTSPYDGKCCMGHEFSSTDSQGLRSSALYTFEGWMNVTGSRVSMQVLGNFNPAGASNETAYHIGTLDLKYKLDHGYISHALNQSNILVDDHGNPATDGPNVKGFLYDWDAYSVSGAPQS